MLMPRTDISPPGTKYLAAPRDLVGGQTADEALNDLVSYLTASFTEPLPIPNQFDQDLISTIPLTPDDPIAPDGTAVEPSSVASGYSPAPAEDPFKPYRAIDPRRFNALSDKLSPGMEELAKYGSSALSSNPLGLTSREIIKQLLRSK